MLRSDTDFIQTVRNFFGFVQMRLGDGCHTDNPIHRRADIVRHGGEKGSAGLIVLLRLPQRVSQILTHVMLRAGFMQHGKVLIAVNRNEINFYPALQFILSSGLIFKAQPLGQPAV